MPSLETAGRWVAARPFVLLPLVAVVGLAGVWAVRSWSGSSASAAGDDQVVEVTVGSMDEVVSAEGTVAVAEQQDASFTAAGTVTAVDVVAGQEVVAGQVMAAIDSAELDAAVAEAETALADAEAALADDSSVGASDAQLEADRTAVTTAEDRLAAALDDLAGSQLVADLDGTVASVDLTVGEELGASGTSGTTATGSGSGSGGSAASLGTGATSGAGLAQPGGATSGDATDTGPAQIVVVSAESFVVDLELDATEVTSVEVGQPASVTLVSSTSSATGGPGGGFPGGTFPGPAGGSPNGTGDDGTDDAVVGRITGTSSATGTVTEVSQVADASSGVARYSVTVAFTDTSGDYAAGASVSVDVVVAQTADDTLSVPVRAVTTTDGASTVRVRTDDGTETRTVTTGATVDGMVAVTEGLAAGESVVVGGPGTGRVGGAGTLPDELFGGQLPDGGLPGGGSSDIGTEEGP